MLTDPQKHFIPGEAREVDTTMKTPPIVTAQEWEAARQQLLVKEKESVRTAAGTQRACSIQLAEHPTVSVGDLPAPSTAEPADAAKWCA
jgi:hypothetical protein